jgi:hypothetical protein
MAFDLRRKRTNIGLLENFYPTSVASDFTLRRPLRLAAGLARSQQGVAVHHDDAREFFPFAVDGGLHSGDVVADDDLTRLDWAWPRMRLPPLFTIFSAMPRSVPVASMALEVDHFEQLGDWVCSRIFREPL